MMYNNDFWMVSIVFLILTPFLYFFGPMTWKGALFVGLAMMVCHTWEKRKIMKGEYR